MQKNLLKSFSVAALFATSSFMLTAHAEDLKNTIRIGYAHIGFNVKSGELAGPPGTTPPGATINVENTSTLAFSYERSLSDNWGVQFQAGIPPALTTNGAGTAAALGTASKAKVWFPTVLAQYTFTSVPVVQPYIGLGVVYLHYTDEEVTTAYTNAVQGSSSSMKLKDSWSPYIRVGLEYPLNKNWSINAEYSTFELNTTATIVTETPGVGPISRTVDLKDTPQVLGLTLGYRF